MWGGQSQDPRPWGLHGNQVGWHIVTLKMKQILPPLHTAMLPVGSH